MSLGSKAALATRSFSLRPPSKSWNQCGLLQVHEWTLSLGITSWTSQSQEPGDTYRANVTGKTWVTLPASAHTLPESQDSEWPVGFVAVVAAQSTAPEVMMP